MVWFQVPHVFFSLHPETNVPSVYFKMNPGSTANIAVMKESLQKLDASTYDDIKFQYLYRSDVDTVLAKSTRRRQNSCIRNRNNGSKELLEFIKFRGIDDVKAMSDEDICSAYFVSVIFNPNSNEFN